MTESEYVDPSETGPGPSRCESLPPDLLEHIEAVYDVIGPYLSTSLEKFTRGFMLGANPKGEVALWCSITAAWIAYHDKYMGEDLLPDEEETKLVAALVAISAGVEDVAELNVPVEVGRRLWECYDELGED
ncbi:MAG: hypothetical protein ACYC6N_03195 [Pirellulaceae bacterium]